MPDFVEPEPARDGIRFFQEENDRPDGKEKAADEHGDHEFGKPFVNRFRYGESGPPHADVEDGGDPLR